MVDHIHVGEQPEARVRVTEFVEVLARLPVRPFVVDDYHVISGELVDGRKFLLIEEIRCRPGEREGVRIAGRGHSAGAGGSPTGVEHAAISPTAVMAAVRANRKRPNRRKARMPGTESA